MATPALDRSILARVEALSAKLTEIGVALDGDATLARMQEPVTPGISSRVSQVVAGLDGNLSGATTTMRESLAIAARQFGPVLADLTGPVKSGIAELEAELEAARAPYTPGRLPAWGGK
jgi:hypothetical protein